jgi:hypothetical protein
MKRYLIILFAFTITGVSAQYDELEVFHFVTPNQTYETTIDGKGEITLFLNFADEWYDNNDFRLAPSHHVTGWYRLKGEQVKKVLVGRYQPEEYLTLYVLNQKDASTFNSSEDSLPAYDKKYVEKFHFPLVHPSQNKGAGDAVWSDGKVVLTVKEIDVQHKNRAHTVMLTPSSGYTDFSALDITQVVTEPFGSTCSDLKEFSVVLTDAHEDEEGNIFLLLQIINEYLIPASASSGGLCFLVLDKHFSLLNYHYVETYNLGNYECVPEEQSIPSSRQRFFVKSWTDDEVFGSFIIENAKFELEKEW